VPDDAFGDERWLSGVLDLALEHGLDLARDLL
jgi:hypothetical protein